MDHPLQLTITQGEELLVHLKGGRDIEEVYINGDMDNRVPHNLNISFNFVEGESLMMALSELAVSSGSACTSASLEPSYVLRALGRSDELADRAVELCHQKISKLRELSPLWDMYKEGIDLSTVQWSAH